MAESGTRVSRSVTIGLGEQFDWASLAGWKVDQAWTLKNGALYMIVFCERQEAGRG